MSGQPLRLLHVLPTYLPAVRYGGPIHAVHGLCRALAAQGHCVTVFTTSVDGKGRSDVPESVPVIMDGVRVRYFRSRFDRLYWAPAMRQALRGEVPGMDLVHLHSVFLWPTTSAAAAARRSGRPYLIAPRGMLVPELISARSSWVKRAWLALVERRNLRGAAAIHCTSAGESDDLRRCGLDLVPQLCVPNGVDVPERIQRNPAPNALLFLGRISWKKNLTSLIDAVRSLPAVTLTLAGPDDEGLVPGLLAQATEAGCGDRVRWIGAVAANDLAPVFASHAALVLPSINENFGNVVAEAMANGCPVVVAPGVGARSLIEQADAGVVAGGGTPEALACAIQTLLGSNGLNEEAGARGRAFTRAQLGWPAVAREMVCHYRRILAGTAGRDLPDSRDKSH